MAGIQIVLVPLYYVALVACLEGPRNAPRKTRLASYPWQ